MTSVKISELPEAGTIAGGELVPVVQDGETRRATASQVATLTGALIPSNNLSDVPNDALAAENLSVSFVVADLAALKALTATPGVVFTKCRATAGDYGGGRWVFRTGDRSANVTADPAEALWAAPDSASTGALGAWQRQYSGDIFFDWFGGKPDGTASAGTDNKTAFDGLFTAIANLGSGNYGAATVRFRSGAYKTTAVTTSVRGVRFIGEGRFGTRIAGYTAAQAHILRFTSANAAFVCERMEIIGWLTTAETANYPTYGLRFDGGTNELSNIEISNCDTCVWMGFGNDCRVTDVKLNEFLTTGAIFGGVDNGGSAGISENRISRVKAYSGSSYRGTGFLFGTDCGATVMENVDCGSCVTAFKITDNLSLGTSLGFLTLSNCTGGNCQIGLHITLNGGNVKINDSVFSGLHATEGDGIRVESTTACIEARGCIFQNCTRSGIYSTAGWSITALACTFRDIGISGGGTNGRAVWAANGSQKYYLLGNVFDVDLQTNQSNNLAYAFYAATGWSGAAYIVGNRATAIVTANYQNDSSSGGTMTILSDNVIEGSFSSAALRITQTGAGDALLIEDSASTDTTPFVIDNTGRVITGDTAIRTYQGSAVPRVQANSTNADISSFGASNWATGATTAGRYLFAKARGNTVGTHTVVASGDLMGTLGWAGSDGTAFIPAASITAEVDGTPGTNDMPGRLLFGTTADGAATITSRWEIDSNGFLNVLSGSLGLGAPVTKTGDFTVATTENWLINNKAGSTCTVTLPAAATFPGRAIMIQNYQAQTVVSASSNVVPLGGGAAGTAILSGTAGRWCTLVSDATNWIIMNGVV